MSRIISVLLTLALIGVLAVPVSAEDSDWIELLEFTSVGDSGSNIFNMRTSITLSIPLHQQMRIRKVDMLLSIPSNQAPTTVSVTAAGSTFNLTLYSIGSNLVRAVGYVPNAVYESLSFTIKKTDTTAQQYQILSCKVSGLGIEEFVADADVYHNGTGEYSRRRN